MSLGNDRSLSNDEFKKKKSVTNVDFLDNNFYNEIQLNTEGNAKHISYNN